MVAKIRVEKRWQSAGMPPPGFQDREWKADGVERNAPALMSGTSGGGGPRKEDRVSESTEVARHTAHGTVGWAGVQAAGKGRTLTGEGGSRPMTVETLPTVFWISEVNLLTVLPLKWDTQQCKLLGCRSLMKSISYDTCLFITESCDNWRGVVSTSSCAPADLRDTNNLDPDTQGKITDPPGRLPRAGPHCSKGFRLECEPTWPEWRYQKRLKLKCHSSVSYSSLCLSPLEVLLKQSFITTYPQRFWFRRSGAEMENLHF